MDPAPLSDLRILAVEQFGAGPFGSPPDGAADRLGREADQV